MSIIENVREYMAACLLLAEIPLKGHIDWTIADANNYGIIIDSDIVLKSMKKNRSR